jgi:hypothetical protein
MIGRLVALICCQQNVAQVDTNASKPHAPKRRKSGGSPHKGQDYSDLEPKQKQTEESDEESSKLGSAKDKTRKNKLVTAYSKGSSVLGANDQASTKEDGASKTGRQSESSTASRKAVSKIVIQASGFEDWQNQQPDSYESFRHLALTAYRHRKSRQNSQNISSNVMPSKVSSYSADGQLSLQDSSQNWCILDLIFASTEREEPTNSSEMARTLLARIGYAEQLVSGVTEGAEMFAEINLSVIRSFTGRTKTAALAEALSM